MRSWIDPNGPTFLFARDSSGSPMSFGVLNLMALGHVWVSAIAGVRSRSLAFSVGLLSLEGLALVFGRGNCPFGPFQRSLGDPVPMFELFLPPRAAKAAIPVLTFVSLAGFAALLLRATVGRPES